MFQRINRILAASLLLTAVAQPTISCTPETNSNVPCHAHSRNSIDVVGRSETIVKSDRAVFSFKLSVMENCLDNLNSMIDGQINTLKQSLNAQGLTDANIQVGSKQVVIQDLQWDGHKKNFKYSIECTINVIIDSVDQAPSIQENTMAFLAKGFKLNDLRMKYHYTNVAELQKQLAVKALQDGQQTADLYAKSLEFFIASTPRSIGQIRMFSNSVMTNPAHDRSWEQSDELYSKFCVEAQMSYEILKESENETETENETKKSIQNDTLNHEKEVNQEDNQEKEEDDQEDDQEKEEDDQEDDQEKEDTEDNVKDEKDSTSNTEKSKSDAQGA